MTEQSINKTLPDDGKRPGVWQLIRPFWVSSEKWLAILLIAVILTINFSNTYASVALNKLHGQLTDALVALDWPHISTIMVKSLAIGTVSTLLPLVSVLSIDYLTLRWRTWMTARYVERWTQRSTYYQLERDNLISNGDQRIAEDINLFTDVTINLSTNIIHVVVNAVTFTIILWGLSGALSVPLGNATLSIPGYMVFAVYLYSFFHLALSHWLGKVLIGVNMNKQTVEADFRFLGMQMRENAEQIAFFGGGEREGQRLLSRFDRVRANTLLLMRKTFKLRFFQSMFTQVFSPLPTLLALPLLLSGKITLGGLTQITLAYGTVLGTLAFFPQAYQSFTNWMALANRLRDMLWALNKARDQPDGIRLENRGAALRCAGVTLQRPDGAVLARLPDWQVAAGERWVVRGRSGSGKSTLLRACAGLWPFGEGAITRPESARMLFLPQKSYIPVGTLKSALAYPDEPEAFTEQQYRQALVDCCLAERVDSLTQFERWQQVLSGGEQQRLAMARVLLHRPDMIFLDEATSALDPETESRLYQALIEQLPNSTIISVAHRKELERFHQHIFNLTPGQGS
ncbi:ABC transporter ATP-binding protein [Brenneria goodwinii]|uniref:ABC transporter ATP binding component n=1 Tax=Brenneria goodwinii TaxID=1109412 RepID=A0A0G4K2F8_9GAMM|nr:MULTISPECIES: ABC transporter ATP-binding protein/permease [Brenneria]ATA24565.1 ABC transporter ATP-binding protein [Brenneria goodwinii]PWC23094.1 ABC transporter ATP-binding protein/permease [Brenneria roseae subsp. roseae]RLM20208.1 ABC transporter ATP-binding protein [Brenneria goodwinii]CPR21458.1 ABC transporter ATP binding component [Brenneria goodwinii]